MKRDQGNDLILGNSIEDGSEILLPRKKRGEHLYVCGATGTGKSKLLENLIRQDIWAWRKSKCGLILLDPHGSLYDSILDWMAYNKLERPLIPIDLRRDDWIISYDVLRQRPQAVTSVVVRNFVQAMAFVWGESDTVSTPLFSRWASNILWTLYEHKKSLADIGELLDFRRSDICRALTENLSEKSVARDWAFASQLTAKDFDAQVSSTLNRIRPFITTPLISQMLGNKQQSLDLGKALEEGSIILLNLATEKGRVTSEDSSLFATLLLSDLWAEAQSRGKSQHGQTLKPFYVYCDEFQNFVTPTIAKNLDQARGFGLHLTLSHQFPNQLLHTGAHGKQIYDSVMVNARTKAVFCMEGDENLRPLAQSLFMGTMSPDRIQFSLSSTKVLKYDEVLRTTKSRSISEGYSSGSQHGYASGSGLGGTEVFPFEEVDPSAISKSNSDFHSNSRSDSDSSSQSFTTGQVQHSMLLPRLGKEVSSIYPDSMDNQLHRAMATLFDQAQRHCVVRIAEQRIPHAIAVPIVKWIPSTVSRTERYLKRQFKKCGCAAKAESEKQPRRAQRKIPLAIESPVEEPLRFKRIIRHKKS